MFFCPWFTVVFNLVSIRWVRHVLICIHKRNFKNRELGFRVAFLVLNGIAEIVSASKKMTNLIYKDIRLKSRAFSLNERSTDQNKILTIFTATYCLYTEVVSSVTSYTDELESNALLHCPKGIFEGIEGQKETYTEFTYST